MREIEAIKIKDAVRDLCLEANFDLSPDMRSALKNASLKESSLHGKRVFKEIEENSEVASKDKLPLCQDTGSAMVYLELGQEVLIIGGDLKESVNEGVRLAYDRGDLRKSIVSDPLIRKNSGDNTPAFIHIDIVPGDKVKIGVLPKGGGGENSSALKMFDPTASRKEITEFIVERVKESGPRACPPGILGIGIGGTFDTVAGLAKKALLRPVGQQNSRADIANLEKEILKEVNKSGVGPMGLGGKVTMLAAHVETAPCHIASLPVAVNFECHAHRYKEKVL